MPLPYRELTPPIWKTHVVVRHGTISFRLPESEQAFWPGSIRRDDFYQVSDHYEPVVDFITSMLVECLGSILGNAQFPRDPEPRLDSQIPYALMMRTRVPDRCQILKRTPQG